MGLDYGEHLATSIVMGRHPSRTPVIDLLAPSFTLPKWLGVGASFGLLLILAAAALYRWATRQS